jgi:hypothetical protein
MKTASIVHCNRGGNPGNPDSAREKWSTVKHCRTGSEEVGMKFARLSVVLIVSIFASAQQSPLLSAPSASKAESEDEIRKMEQSQRVFGLMPIFGVTNRPDAPPLSVKEKFRLMAKEAVDPFEFVAIGVEAGIGQVENEFEDYGQGAAGYSKRYGAALADNAASDFFSNFVYPVLLREDPRYFRLGGGSVKRRFVYSISRILVCRKDDGGNTFNFSSVLGAMTAGGISNAYYQPSDRGFRLTMSRAGISLLYGTVGTVVEEFWPDIRNKMLHNKRDAQQLPWVGHRTRRSHISPWGE